MTTSEKLVRNKMSLLELAEHLKNVSEACRLTGVSRQHFYDIRQAHAEGGLEALKEKSRRQANLKNRVMPEVEEAVARIALEYPAYGKTRAANELHQQGILVSSGGVQSVWERLGLETLKKRLSRLEEKSAQEGLVYTEAQVAALEKAARERVDSLEDIETHHPGYLLGQDTFYVGYLKGVGRVYQQTVIDTYSRVSFAKLYTAKVAVIAADVLNDRVLPFFEQQNVPVLRMLTDRGTEYCGKEDTHPYQVFLGLNDIEHSKTQAYHPQTNGITERFHQTILNEFYKVAFRKKIYSTIEDLQADVDAWLVEYNHRRTHQGKRCDGKTPMQTFLNAIPLVREKMMSEQLEKVS